MKLFVDSADVAELKALAATGLVDGVTTNPSLIAKQGGVFLDTIAQICALVDGPVSAEVASTDYETILKEGERLAEIAANVVVKLPLTWDGLKAAKHFARNGVKTNVTLCFSAVQALMAAKAGATYVSPFVGRLDDINAVGMELIQDLVEIFANYDLTTNVLAASIRSPRHVTDAALAGAHVATIPTKVFDQMLAHPLTDKGIEGFLADWKKSGR